MSDNNIMRDMQKSLSELLSTGWNYPNSFKRKDLNETLRLEYGHLDKETLETSEPIEVTVAGRIMIKRRQGKIAFMDLVDSSGKIQLYIQKNVVGEDLYEIVKSTHRGDIVGIKGVLYKTMKGEFSINVMSYEILNKCLMPLPEKFHGLSDQETCYRQRYIDLMMNEETRNTFKRRSKIISYIRNYFNERDFMEVETPTLQSIPSGANAKKFDTHMNSLNLDLSLRVAPELSLKKLVVGGLESVYEIGKNFRNEGLSTRHNPEFTMIEFYQAYSTYHDLMDLTEDLLKGIALDVCKSEDRFMPYGEHNINFGNTFKRLTVLEAIQEHSDVSLETLLDYDSIVSYAKSIGLKIDANWGLGRIQMEVFDEVAETKLIQPTFITEYPVEVSPLARLNNKNPNVTDRFELFIAGRELANGFSELNDAQDQHERFMKQIDAKSLGDDEAMPYDEDYVTALKYALPPTAGEGIGIDRLVMLFTNSHTIKDVILFPQVKSID